MLQINPVFNAVFSPYSEVKTLNGEILGLELIILSLQASHYLYQQKGKIYVLSAMNY